MNADLERDLLEAGDGLGDVVAALRRAPQAHVSEDFAARVRSLLPHGGGSARVRPRWSAARVLLAAAASLACAFVFVAFLVRKPVPPQEPVLHLASSSRQADGPFPACQRADGSFSSSSAAPYVQAFAVTALAKDPSSDRAALDRAVDALVRTQGADGGWGNAALSARNVAALAQAEAAGVARAHAARRRGLRYLRMHGIGELSAADLARAAKDAFARLDKSCDAGLVYSVSLACRGDIK